MDSVETGGELTTPTSRSIPIPLEWESDSKVTLGAAKEQQTSVSVQFMYSD